MATVPQRELRNNTAELLRRVERGERLTITVHGHPVADLVPPVPPEATRYAQGPLTESGGVGDPLAPDRLHADGATRAAAGLEREAAGAPS